MKTHNLVVHLPDTRGITISHYGKGNAKIGADVFTYSRLAGQYELLGTCPGSTPECEEICYAKRIKGIVSEIYRQNSRTDDVPTIPDECQLLRIHVSGDFNTPAYISNWVDRLTARPDVTAWAYTRSWRVPHLLANLEQLRDLPNMQLFASMDVSTVEMPPAGWRIAWIDGDPRAGRVRAVSAHENDSTLIGEDGFIDFDLQYTQTGTKAVICPEETGTARDCIDCGFCMVGQRNDVIFLKH